MLLLYAQVCGFDALDPHPAYGCSLKISHKMLGLVQVAARKGKSPALHSEEPDQAVWHLCGLDTGWKVHSLLGHQIPLYFVGDGLAPLGGALEAIC